MLHTVELRTILKKDTIKSRDWRKDKDKKRFEEDYTRVEVGEGLYKS